MDDFQKVNEIYGSYFEIGNEPARETVEVSGLTQGS
jgi:enamine deaminase RidA (YjgF/YER057c/UK114 family)